MNLNDLRKNAYQKAASPLPTNNTPKDANKMDEVLVKVPIKESVYRRVAKFLILIGVEDAAKVIPLLTAEQRQKIILEVASIRTISEEEKSAILEEFDELYKNVKLTGGKETAREILTRAYGAEKADSLLQKTVPFTKGRPFEYLNNETPERITTLLSSESNLVRTLVLSNIQPEKAAKVINALPKSDKKEVILRLAKIEPIQSDVLQRVDKAIYEKAQTLTEESAIKIDGRDKLTSILKAMPVTMEQDILNMLDNDATGLSEDLRQRLFTLDDVINAQDKYIQERLQAMSAIDIARLIAKKKVEFRQKILTNISQGRRQEVLDEEKLTPLLKADCERVTSSFIERLRSDYEKGLLIIVGRNDKDFV